MSTFAHWGGGGNHGAKLPIFVLWRIELFGTHLVKHRVENADALRGMMTALFWSERYLDGGVKRRPVRLFEAGSDVQHVHLAPRHHYPHQGVVISSSTLSTETDSRTELCYKARVWPLNALLIDFVREAATTGLVQKEALIKGENLFLISEQNPTKHPLTIKEN